MEQHIKTIKFEISHILHFSMFLKEDSGKQLVQIFLKAIIARYEREIEYERRRTPMVRVRLL